MIKQPPKTRPPKPPTKEGVSPSRLYLEKLPHPPATLFHFLCQRFPHISPDEWQSRFDEGQVLAEDLTVLSSDAPYCHGRTIYYYRTLKDEIPVPFCHDIVFENDEFMVVDKPHFLTVSPSGDYVKETLLTRLKTQTNNPELSPIHRLDRQTAGLILISKNPATRHNYETLAGFIMYRLRKIPRPADFVVHEHFKFEVVDIDHYKIDQVLVTRLPLDADEVVERDWM